jgi:hypothetical protein
MSNAFESTKSGSTIGHAGLGIQGDLIGSVRQIVHDGDTIKVRAIGNISTRFLGVDAPEISFTLPGKTSFTILSNIRWEDFLRDPLNPQYGDFSTPLSPGLQVELQNRVGPGAATNHYHHAQIAQKALEDEIINDISILDETDEIFQFYLSFSYEVMDRYGRVLCFVNRNQPKEDVPAPRPLSYNERLLAKGVVTPYFIWPNISPFRKYAAAINAVLEPFSANQIKDVKFQSSRAAYQLARQQNCGVYDANNPLRLYPFEVRFLAQRRPPVRWVIDLSKSNDILVPPQEYFMIPNPEDRLYIPEEFVPLFTQKGWKI